MGEISLFDIVAFGNQIYTADFGLWSRSLDLSDQCPVTSAGIENPAADIGLGKKQQQPGVFAALVLAGLGVGVPESTIGLDIEGV